MIAHDYAIVTRFFTFIEFRHAPNEDGILYYSVFKPTKKFTYILCYQFSTKTGRKKSDAHKRPVLVAQDYKGTLLADARAVSVRLS